MGHLVQQKQLIVYKINEAFCLLSYSGCSSCLWRSCWIDVIDVVVIVVVVIILMELLLLLLILVMLLVLSIMLLLAFLVEILREPPFLSSSFCNFWSIIAFVHQWPDIVVWRFLHWKKSIFYCMIFNRLWHSYIVNAKNISIMNKNIKIILKKKKDKTKASYL